MLFAEKSLRVLDDTLVTIILQIIVLDTLVELRHLRDHIIILIRQFLVCVTIDHLVLPYSILRQLPLMVVKFDFKVLSAGLQMLVVLVVKVDLIERLRPLHRSIDITVIRQVLIELIFVFIIDLFVQLPHEMNQRLLLFHLAYSRPCWRVNLELLVRVRVSVISRLIVLIVVLMSLSS